MKVLLINTNPVVSRLTSLSARKESIKLDEIKEITELKNNSNYNIIFVDYDSLSKDVINFIKESKAKKKVCFYTKDDNEKELEGIFNFQILKPFLPSEVSAIIRDCKMEMEKELEEQKIKENVVSLDELISQKDDLKTIDLPEEKEEAKPKETSKIVEKKEEEIIIPPTPKKEKEEIQKEEVIELGFIEEKREDKAKEEVKEIKKEIKEEEPIILGAKLQEEPKKETKEKIDSKKEIEKETKPEKETLELFELDNDTQKDEKEDNIKLFEPDSKEEEKIINTKEEDDIFDLDIDSKNEVKFNILEDKEDDITKILDKDEISNIKTLLENDNTPENLSLDDILASSSINMGTISKKEKKKKKKKSKKIKKAYKNENKEAVEVLTDTIKALPVEELRQLLRGTKIYITIEFPDK